MTASGNNLVDLAGTSGKPQQGIESATVIVALPPEQVTASIQTSGASFVEIHVLSRLEDIS